ncbi:MAG: methylmalonyl Co-A mutase-associated GTPase MeaB [Verrucomicrobiota bacterium JB022]|nr:methylmalonyl Co-A mutase-associated GTPase MeaB [Verrucomicrobiota bacterium JB022]
MAKDAISRPEWAEGGPEQGFNSFVRAGTEPALSRTRSVKRRPTLQVEDYVKGVLAGDRTTLGRAITLIESNAPAHRELAKEVLAQLLPHAGRSVRVGITGVPGAGKSTTIETIGKWLCDEGHRLAVLAIDPSSSVTKGSILGDKTRMVELSRHPNAFIRPSPNGGTLGGVARKTRETLLLCEAFGCDIIILETVGVGQSEVTVRSMVDFFLLVSIAGAGDELQGIKKGVIELADLIAVNKADGDNLQRARMAKAELNRVLSFLAPATEGWKTKAVMYSALTREGIPELWQKVEEFRQLTLENGQFERRRERQRVEWMDALLTEGLHDLFFRDASVQGRLVGLRQKVAQGEVPAAQAAEELLSLWNQ